MKMHSYDITDKRLTVASKLKRCEVTGHNNRRQTQSEISIKNHIFNINQEINT